MSTTRTIAKNTFFLFVLRASGFVLSFFLGMRLARSLGSEGFGVFTLATTYLQVFVLVPNFGFDTLAIRDLARNRAGAPAYVANMVAGKLALMIPAFALLVVATFLLDYPPATREAILVLGACIFFDPLAEAAAAIFQGFERMELLTAISGGAKVITTGLSLVLLERGAGVLDILRLQLAGSAAVIPVFALMTRGLLPGVLPRPSMDGIRALAREAAPLFWTNLLGLLYLRTDVLLLSKMRGESEVGLYGAASSVLRALSMLPGIFVTAMYPALSRYFDANHDGGRSLRRLCDTAFRWQLALGIPIVVGISTLGRPIIDLVYGAQFDASGPTLSILIWALLFFFTNTLLGYMLFTANRQRDFFWIKLATLVLNLGLNFVLIPRFGIVGAAWSTVATTAISFVFHERLVAKHLYPVRFLALAWKPIVAGALLAAGVRAMNGFSLGVVVAAGAAIFAVSMVLMRFLTQEDFDILRRLLRREKPPLPPEAPRKDST